MRLTIGFATHSDFDGLYFSINALRMYHADVMPQCELVVVDNAPDSRCGQRAQGLFTHINAGMNDPHSILPQPYAAKYVPFGDVVGTSAPRQKIFDVATGDAVLVMDSHVLCWPGSIKRLLDYYEQNPDTRDLLSGPLMYDNLAGTMSHFQDVWRDGMWGIWGHDPRGQDIDGPPFEIEAQGLGLFSCRRDAWLGFNPDFREFGGEEWYIHTKFRQAGARCLCLPFLRWQHRFGDPAGGRKSPATVHGKVRNYVIGHQELGLSMDRLQRHVVDGINEDTGKAESRDGRLTAKQLRVLQEFPEIYPPASLSAG